VVALADRPIEEAVTRWLTTLLEAMRSREDLLRVIVYEVPVAIREPHRLEAFERHLSLARAAYVQAGDRVRQDRVEEVSFLLVTLVDAALTRMVLEPPAGLHDAAVMDELATRVLEWVAPR